MGQIKFLIERIDISADPDFSFESFKLDVLIPIVFLNKPPIFLLGSPVKDPLACPKSSDSSRLSGMAAQLMAINGPWFDLL
jgi:hypothetical protein